MQHYIKPLLTFLLLSFCTLTIAQNRFSGEIVTIDNQKIPVVFLIKASIYNANRLKDIQEKITVIQNGTTIEYIPADLNGFTIALESGLHKYESVDNVAFAEILYSNKVKLYKFLKYVNNGSLVRFYVIKKPNITELVQMPAMGLSNLITKKDMLPAIKDCQVSYDKINNGVVKIKDETVLVEFMKDYESNCF